MPLQSQSTNIFDTLSGQTGCLPVILNIDCSGQEEASADNTHKAGHIQCKLQAGIVRHKVFVTKMQQETVCNLQCINTHKDKSLDITKKYKAFQYCVFKLGCANVFWCRFLIEHWPDASDYPKRYGGTTLIQIHTVLA